ncbi:MAG: integrase [Sphingomonadales bacterium 32-68-7]|nr:MAG: integrase [Sphingomonadales bacterium 12-68-11]OYX10090.1 MAG: integrase [Sphingomonadales bacterium 32-68-7]
MDRGLTKAALEAAAIRARESLERIELRDDREPGLRFRAGERSAGWSLLVQLKTGQRSRVKLGTWPGMGLAEARVAARDTRTRIDKGGDPNAEKRDVAKQAAREARNRITLCEVLDTYETLVLATHRKGAETRRALDGKKGLLTSLRTRRPTSITRQEIVDLVRKGARTAPIAANRKLAYASAFFNWCVDQGILETNPAVKIRKPGRENVRDRFHTLAELREIWAAAGTLGYPFEQMFRLLIVLPNRRDEIASLPLAELTLGNVAEPFDEAVWVLPASRTKRANALRIPLSPLAREILIAAIHHPDRPKDSKLVFTTTSETPISGFAKARRRLDLAIARARQDLASASGEDLDACENMPHWTVHDLRTTFNTHACEILDVPPHVADRILNHVATATRSKVMRVYNKSELFEPRREALNSWAHLLRQHVL